MNVRRSYATLAAAGALIAVSSALATIPFHSAEPAASEATESCGSVFLPINTWTDCNQDRNSMAYVVVLLALISVVLTTAAAVMSRSLRTSRAPLGRTARTSAVVTTLLAVALSTIVLVTPAGSSRCGATIRHLTTPPSDGFEGADRSCIDAYSARWLTAGVGVVLTAAASAVIATSRPSSRTSPWLAAAVTATMAASIVVPGLAAIEWIVAFHA